MSDESKRVPAPHSGAPLFTPRPFHPLSVERVRGLLSGRFDVVRELGAGGTSVVYLARDRERGGDVAVKVLRPELSAAVIAARFMREVELGQRLEHPNILPILESGVAEDELFCVMPFIDGETLQQRLARQTHLSIDETLNIARAVAAALDYAHSVGVIHRDIKPANILITGDRVVVADFGIARAMTVAATSQLTESGVVLGTAAYMSPEQGSGDQRIDGRTDVYALGCVVYEMLGGEPPFTGPTARAIIARHYQEEPRSLRVIRPAVTEGMQGAVWKALAKIPNDRYATAGEFVDALEAGSRDPRSTPARWPRTASSMRRGRWRAALIVLASILVGFVVVATRGTMFRGQSSGPLIAAIRPFQGDSSHLGWLAAALETRLANALFDAPDLTLRSTSTVAAYSARRIPDDSLARLLDVDLFLDGRVVPSGDSIEVTVQLVDARRAVVLAVGTARQPVRTPSEQLLDVASSKLAVALLPAVGKEVAARRWATSRRDTVALHLRHRAQGRRWAGEALIYNDARAAERAFAEADSFLVLAASRDRRWAEPRVARLSLASRRALAAFTIRDTSKLRRIIDQGIASADTILSENPQSGEALAYRGLLRWRKYLWVVRTNRGPVLDSAEADLRKAATAPQPVALAAGSLSEILYMVRSQFAEAREFAKQAFEMDAYLDNAGLVINRLALTSLNLGDDVEAAKWCRMGLRRYPDQVYHIACMLEVMAWGTQPASPDSAWIFYRSLVSRDPDPLVHWHYLLRVAAVHARAGERSDAERILSQVRREVSDAHGDRTLLLPWEAGVCFRIGKVEEGERLFGEYRAARPEDASVRATGYPLRGYVAPRISH